MSRNWDPPTLAERICNDAARACARYAFGVINSKLRETNIGKVIITPPICYPSSLFINITWNQMASATKYHGKGHKYKSYKYFFLKDSPEIFSSFSYCGVRMIKFLGADGKSIDFNKKK